MKSFLELVKVLSMLTAVGALFWGVFAVISAAREFGGDGDPSGALSSAGTVFLVAVAVSLLAGRLMKKAG